MAVEPSEMSCSNSIHLSDNERKSKERDDLWKELGNTVTGLIKGRRVACGVLGVCFSYRLWTLCLRVTKVSLYTLQNPYLAL